MGQAVGVVVAKSQAVADQAASLIQLSYSSSNSVPITNLSEAIENKSFFEVDSDIEGVTLLEVHTFVVNPPLHYFFCELLIPSW